MTLQSLCDLIVVIGAAYFTIVKICNSFIKPASKLRDKQKERDKEKLQLILDEIMPTYFPKQDRQEYLDDVRDEVKEGLQGSFDHLSELIQHQNTQIEELNQKIEQLTTSSKDVIRESIMSIYAQNKAERALSISQRDMLDRLYKDYKDLDGNSYIDRYYELMEDWEIQDDGL